MFSKVKQILMSRDIKLILLFVPCLLWDVMFWSVTWLQKNMKRLDEIGENIIEDFLNKS